jgi:hypothetical protein
MNLRIMRLSVKWSATFGRVAGMLALTSGLVLACLPEAGCTMYKEHPAKSFADATGGEGLERVFWKNVAAGNWTEIDRVLASNYSGVSASGTPDKAAALEQYRQWQLKEYSLGDLKTELNGSTIVVTYTITLNGTAGNSTAGNGSASGNGAAPLPSAPQHMMSVWQQQKSGWVEIAHSVTLP